MKLEALGADAGRLLAFALTPRARPANTPEYDDLLKRLRQDAELRALTEAVAEGLGLMVLGVGPTGLALGCRDDSPFAMRLPDYRAARSIEERVLHGLIQLAIAAWCFPNAEDLEDDDAVRRVHSRDLVEHLARACRDLEAKASVDPDLGTPELQEAWRAVLARPETKETPDERRTASSLIGMCEYALERLGAGGLMQKEEDGSWRTTQAYRLQVRELAAHEAYRLVREALRAEEAR